MPDGIIRDPKMNSNEANFGILFHTTAGIYCAYKKGNDPNKRILPSGFKVFCGEKQQLNNPITWDDQKIWFVVDITIGEDPENPDAENEDQPVVMDIKNFLNTKSEHFPKSKSYSGDNHIETFM